MNGLHGIIFAYEKEPGLRELVARRMPASIPFGGRYRVIDFALSNLQNAGIKDVGVVLHGNYQSLLDHLGSGKTWNMSLKHGGLRLLPPFADNRKYQSAEFRGKMEALAGVRSYLTEIRQDYVVLADSDLIVNLPIAEVFEAHLASGADITCVCTAKYDRPENATYFQLDGEGRVVKTLCDPYTPEGYHCLEYYILKRDLLIKLVDDCAAQEKFSFRSDVLLGMLGALDIRGFVWNGFAAQLRTLKEYYDRSMELLDPAVASELFSLERPITAKEDDEASSYIAPGSRVTNALIADGCFIEGTVENSIVFPGVRVEKGAVVRNSILFKNSVVEENASLRYVIADKSVLVRSGSELVGHEKYPIAIEKESVI